MCVFLAAWLYERLEKLFQYDGNVLRGFLLLLLYLMLSHMFGIRGGGGQGQAKIVL